MKILRYIKAALIIAPVVFYYHFFFINRFAKHPEKYPIEYRYKIIRKEIRLALKLLHVDYNLYNYDKFANMKQKGLIVSNHLSDADPLILIAKSEKPLTFISKKEVVKFPFVGKITKALEVFPIDRSNLMSQISQIKEIVSFLKDETKPSVIVYIEGTRNRHPENPCLEFHPGTLKIAQMAGVPLMTCATYGTFRVLDKKSYLKRVPTYFSFLKTYSPEEMKNIQTTEFAVLLKEEIDKEVDNLRKIDLDYINSLKISKKRRKLETFCDSRVMS